MTAFPIHAIEVANVRVHSEGRLMYPGAHAMAEQASAQNVGTLLGIQFGAVVPGHLPGS